MHAKLFIKMLTPRDQYLCTSCGKRISTTGAAAIYCVFEGKDMYLAEQATRRCECGNEQHIPRIFLSAKEAEREILDVQAKPIDDCIFLGLTPGTVEWKL